MTILNDTVLESNKYLKLNFGKPSFPHSTLETHLPFSNTNKAGV